MTEPPVTYEHKIITLFGSDDNREQKLNEWSREGWQVVVAYVGLSSSVAGDRLILRRVAR